MKKLSFFIILLLLIVSCAKYKTEYSDTFKTYGIVTTHEFTPAHSETEISPNLTPSSGPIGIGFNGPGFNIGKMVITNEDRPDYFVTVVKTEVGEVTIVGSDENAKLTYDNVDLNHRVEVSYNYQLLVKYDKEMKNREVIGSTFNFVRLHFIPQ